MSTYDVTNFVAIPYSEGVLLKWTAGEGIPDVSAELINDVTDRTFPSIGHWQSVSTYPLAAAYASGGVLNIASGPGPLNVIGKQQIGLPAAYIGDSGVYAFHTGTIYRITYTYTGTANGFRFQTGGGNQVIGTLIVGVANAFTFTCTANATSLMLVATALSATGTLTDVSIVEVSSTTSDKCKVTIQYSNSPLLYNIPNTPPYVVRDLGQYQFAQNFVYHRNLVDGLPYYYALFIYYEDSKMWYGPYKSAPVFVTPLVSKGIPFSSGSLSYSKLGINTRISPLQDNVVEVLVWLPISLSDRQPAVEAALNDVRPAHIELKVGYEHFYIAHTTTQQFSGSMCAKNIYEIVNGTMTNTRPTIDSSFDGTTGII